MSEFYSGNFRTEFNLNAEIKTSELYAGITPMEFHKVSGKTVESSILKFRNGKSNKSELYAEITLTECSKFVS